MTDEELINELQYVEKSCYANFQYWTSDKLQKLIVIIDQKLRSRPELSK